MPPTVLDYSSARDRRKTLPRPPPPVTLSSKVGAIMSRHRRDEKCRERKETPPSPSSNCVQSVVHLFTERIGNRPHRSLLHNMRGSVYFSLFLLVIFFLYCLPVRITCAGCHGDNFPPLFWVCFPADNVGCTIRGYIYLYTFFLDKYLPCSLVDE